MSSDRRPNKKAATEDEVGLIHNLTTKLYTARLEYMLRMVQEGANVEDVIGDGKALAAAGKWAADMNSITTRAPEMDEESELSKKLDAIKNAQSGKGAGIEAISFDDEENF